MADESPTARDIYEAVVDALSRCGEFRVHAQKTRIAFISRMSFASLTFGRSWGNLSLILPTPIDDERMRKLVLYGPSSWGHTIRLGSAGEVDQDVESWLCEALRRGDQVTLDPGGDVAPVSGHSLDVFHTAFRAMVTEEPGGIVVELPRHVAQALSQVEFMEMRIRGVSRITLLRHDRGGSRISVGGTGLVAGESTDVYLRLP